MLIYFDKGTEEIEIIGTQILPILPINRHPNPTAPDKEVHIDIPPIANNQTIIINEDTQANITLTGNDEDSVSNDTLRYNITDMPIHGRLAGTFPNLVYKPNKEYSGNDSFTFKVNDGLVDSGNTATVNITVASVNDAPVAIDDKGITNEDTPVNINIMANDTDIDSGNNLTITSVPSPTAKGGSTIINDNGSITYKPILNFNGVDTFMYRISDQNHNITATGIVTITVTDVNDIPVANNQSVWTDEDISKSITLRGRDADHDDKLTYYILSGPTHGELININELNGSVTYIPPPNYAGQDSFTFKVNDGLVDSGNTATVSIRVNSINDAPVAANSTSTTDEDKRITVTLRGFDVDNDPLKFSLSSDIIGGLLTSGELGNIVPVNKNSANITYLPDPHFYGNDSFTFKVNDGLVDSGKAGLASIIVKHVNHSPISNANTDQQTINENITNVKLNGSSSYDPDNGDTIVSYSWSQIANGSPVVILNNVNSATPTFAAPSVKSDTLLLFNLRVIDNNGAISKPDAVAVIVKNVNIPPVSNAGTDQTVNENTTGVTLNGTKSYDKDGNIASYKWQQISGPTVILSNPTAVNTIFTAPPVTHETVLRFHLTATDNDKDVSIPSTVAVIVKNVNIPPVANAGTDQTVNGEELVILNGSQSYDPDGDRLQYYTWRNISGPDNIELQENSTAQPSFRTPTTNINNTVIKFELVVDDGKNKSKPDSVNIIVKGILQGIREISPQNFAIAPDTNTSLSVLVSPPFTQENSGDSITISGDLRDISNQSGIGPEDINIKIQADSKDGQGKLLYSPVATTKKGNGYFEYTISSFRQPQGSYIVSAEPSSPKYNTAQLKATQKLEVGPRPLSVGDVSTYVGLIATAVTLITLLPRWLHGKTQRKNLSMYISKIDYMYKTLDNADKGESKKHLEEIRYELVQLLNKGKINQEQYGVLDKKVSDYIGKIEKDNIS